MYFSIILIKSVCDLDIIFVVTCFKILYFSGCTKAGLTLLLSSRTRSQVDVITSVESQLDTLAVVISTTTVSSISSAPKTGFPPKLSASSTIQTAQHTLHSCCSLMASAATSLRQRVFQPVTCCSPVQPRPSRQVIACRFVTSLWVQ